MKKTMKHILALVIILPFLFVSCQKSELTNELDKPSKTGDLKSSIEYCGEPLIANLVDWEQSIIAGNLVVANTNSMLYINFEASADWNLTSTYLYVGPASDVPGEVFEGDTGSFAQWAFPYFDWHAGGTQSFSYSFDLSNFDDCFIVVAYSNVVNVSTGDQYIVWGKNNLKTSGYYLEYCKQECEPPVYDCETAFAYGEDLATCFLDIPAIKNNRWGWTNGSIDEGTYSWPIYAGAGQCNIDNGTWVGTLDVEYFGDQVTVTYNIDGDFTLEETHLFVGDDILPKKKNKYTTAPGQFPYKGESSYTIDVSDFDEVFVVAHSVVCGDYDE